MYYTRNLEYHGTQQKNNKFNRPDERKKLETNTIYKQKEITVITKTVDNIATSQTIVLNTYVTKTLSTKKKLKKTSLKIRQPLTNSNTLYQSICNKVIAWKNTNKQKEHST